MKGGCDLKDYKVNRILQLGVSIIIILHEAIHYYKRLLYFITCQMVSRITIIDGKQVEGGNLLEEILFGWKVDENGKRKSSEKINIKTAFNLLNANLYNKSVEEVKKILSQKKKEEQNKEEEIEEGELLKKFKQKVLGLSDQNKYEQFLKNNKNKLASASKVFSDEKYEVEYFPVDHRTSKK